MLENQVRIKRYVRNGVGYIPNVDAVKACNEEFGIIIIKGVNDYAPATTEFLLGF